MQTPKICAVIFTISTLHAQVAGTISGFVKDPTGAIVPGATVTAVLIGQQLTRGTESDSTGFYNMLSLQPGAYEISTTAQGFEKQVQGGVRLTSATATCPVSNPLSWRSRWRRLFENRPVTSKSAVHPRT